MARIDDQLETARWWRDFRATNNDHFLPLLWDQHRFLVLMGGGGSGKSIFAGRKILERVTTEPGHRWLVCRKVARTLRDSCFAQLVGQANDYYGGAGIKINKSDMRISFANGSEILFAGLDDPEKLKSIFDITGIWIEEASELAEEDFIQLNIRLRTIFPHYLQMIITFNPISITHWLKSRFFDRQDDDVKTDRSTYKDNRFLIPDAVRTLEGFRTTDPYYYQVYALGEWGVTGKTVFNAAALTTRLSELPKPDSCGFFDFVLNADGIHIDNPVWVEEQHGPITIYKAPEPGRPYVIGGDTAGEGSDWFIGQVLDNATGEQVAVLRHQYDEDTYARQMYCLGKYYNDALIGVETNYSTYPVKLLDLMGYRRLYVRETEDSYTGTLKKSFGFRTTPITRPVIISELVRIMRDGTRLIQDRTTIEEMLTFVRNEKLRAEAASGAHDDCVMALAIAHYIRDQQTTEIRLPDATTEQAWTEDMWEDYRNADAGGREYLISKWGKPRR